MRGIAEGGGPGQQQPAEQQQQRAQVRGMGV